MADGVRNKVALFLFFVFWYAGNMKFNEYNTAALNGVGGKNSGMTSMYDNHPKLVQDAC